MAFLLEVYNESMRFIFKKIVENFEPQEITKMSLWKYSDECDALAALKFYFPDKYKNLIHSDSPDLQDGNKIGIEVTQANGETYNKTIGEWTDYRTKGNVESLNKVREIVEQKGGYVFEDGAIFHGARGIEDDFADAKNVIDKKIKKLSKYRNKFSECDLLILMESPLDGLFKLATNYLLDKQNNCVYKYDKLLILTCSELYSYDFKTKKEETITIEPAAKSCIFMVGVMVVNGFLKDVDDAFEVIDDE